MTMLFPKRLFTLATVGLLAAVMLTHKAAADERIISHDIWLQAEKDRSVTITEIIKVDARNKKIGNGIIRYVDIDSVLGGTSRLKLLSALRDDAPTRALVEEKGLAARIELGWPTQTADKPGVTTFKLRYNVSEKINTAGALDRIALDSLFGIWPVPMESAKVRIIVPEGIAPVSWYGRLDKRVTHGDGVIMEKLDHHKISIALTAPLAARKMFGVGLAWPEGAIASPSLVNIALGWFDTSPITATIGGMYGLLTLFLFLAAVVLERRSEKVFLDSPSLDSRILSPAALRVFIKRHFDKRSFIAIILGLAAKGHLNIIDEPDGITLHRNKNSDCILDMSAEETALDEALFHNGTRTEIKLDAINNGAIESACHTAEWILREYTGPRFWRNSYAFFYWAVIMAVLGAGLVLHISQPLNVAPYSIAAVLAIFGLVCVNCGNNVVEMYHTARLTGWIDAARGHLRGPVSAVIMAGAVGFLGWYLAKFVGVNGALSLMGLFAVALGFHVFSHGPTAEGRALVEQGQAWKKAMSRIRRLGREASQDVNEQLKLFEKGMGPSYALCAEKAWRRAFREAFKRNDSYYPSWYRGYEFDPLKLENKLHHQLEEAKVKL